MEKIMKTLYNYLNDSSFLLELFREHVSEQLVKITVLNYKEKPLKEIQGKITDGNISINGNSSVRRTANLSVFIEKRDANYMEIGGYFSINKKVNIEIGIINTSQYYKNYDILWFPLGVYGIINLSISHSDTGTSVSLQLKDKMCFLNGECGGVIPAAVTFHEYEVYDPATGDYVLERPTLIQIIREVVNHYGNEQLGKIIINDLSPRVKQIMKWTQSTPLYMYKNGESYELSLDSRGNDADKIFEAGMDIGYIYTDFTYPHNSELIGDAGSSVCDILDKIKNVLGNYEYFYDINGNFVFQEIKNYLNTSKATVDLKNMNQSDYLIDRKNGKAVYVFDDSYIIKSYSNSPQYSMIKNDFVVWGLRESANGKKLPIRYHLAIDSKPRIGNTYECVKIVRKDSVTDADTISYKVAVEYENLPRIGEIERLYKWQDNFYIWDPEDFDVLSEANLGNERPYYSYPLKDEDGKEKGFEYRTHYIKLDEDLQKITTADWRTELYLSGAMTSRFGNDSNDYYVELANEWPKLYDIEKGQFYEDVLKYPNEIDYYLDFIDSDAAISELSISSIGRRTKVINDDNINCIFEQEIPSFVLLRAGDEDINNLREEAKSKGESFIQVESDIYDTFALGGTQNSAYNMVRDLLYQYTSYNETISIQMNPMYFLTEPNIRITVQDKESGIYGDYMLNSITIPLNISGLMSLSCARALERI